MVIQEEIRVRALFKEFWFSCSAFSVDSCSTGLRDVYVEIRGYKMSTKAELEVQVAALLEQVAEQEALATNQVGTNISNCNIDMGEACEMKLVVAQAVLEGMLALQTLWGDNYGIYIGSKPTRSLSDSYGLEA